MGNIDLGMLILAGVCGIGLIQLIMWLILMIRHPGVDDFRLDLVEASSSQPSGGNSAHGSNSARVKE
jgi:hypothetical protein